MENSKPLRTNIKQWCDYIEVKSSETTLILGEYKNIVFGTIISK